MLRKSESWEIWKSLSADLHDHHQAERFAAKSRSLEIWESRLQKHRTNQRFQNGNPSCPRCQQGISRKKPSSPFREPFSYIFPWAETNQANVKKSSTFLGVTWHVFMSGPRYWCSGCRELHSVEVWIMHAAFQTFASMRTGLQQKSNMVNIPVASEILQHNG